MTSITLPPSPPAEVAAILMERAELIARPHEPEALAEISARLDTAVRTHAATWLTVTDASLADEVDRAKRLAAALVEAVQSICDLRGASAFLGGVTAGARGCGAGYTPLTAFSGFDKVNGEPLTFDAVLGGVLVWLDRVDPT